MMKTLNTKGHSYIIAESEFSQDYGPHCPTCFKSEYSDEREKSYLEPRYLAKYCSKVDYPDMESEWKNL